MLPEITDFGTCKVCGWGNPGQSLCLTYQEFGCEINDFGQRIERRMKVACGRCDYTWFLPLEDEIKGDRERFLKEWKENPSSTKVL